MRNLKKILALVLALVMSFSLVSMSSAAFKDAESFTDDYVEAVEVLTGLKVIKGYDDGSFNPKGNITRAEAAALIYRIVTGDVKDELVDIYAGYGKFADVAANNWAAGYVGYCANAEFIKGYDANTFGPKDNVTGYQMLTMLLRALGYGKNGEFTGPNWAVNTARYAEALGLLDNVTSAHAALSLPATRELVCELVFSAITKTPMVRYTLLTNYTPIIVEDAYDFDGDGVADDFEWTLGYETFGLVGTEFTYDGENHTVFQRNMTWGRPGYYWFVDNDRKITNGWNWNAGYRVAFFAQEADLTFNAPQDECCVYADLGVNAKAYVGGVCVNGNWLAEAEIEAMFGGNREINANNTKTMIGEQGRQVEFYAYYVNPMTGEVWYDVIMIDTFFAVVDDVTEVEYDKKGHIAEYAELTLNIYTNDTVVNEIPYDTVVLTSEENWTYEESDLLLVNAITNDSDDETIDMNAFWNGSVYTHYVEIVGEPEVFVGAQSAFSNQPTHIVDGTEYNDAYQLVVDQAGLETTKHIWVKDQFGNIIAILDNLTEYSYGTISAIKWVDTNDLLNNGYAYATITNMDGEQADFKVVSIDGVTLKGVEGDVEVYGSTVSSTKQYNSSYCNVALYRIEETSSGLKLTTLTKLNDTAKVVNGVAEIGFTADLDDASTEDVNENFKVFGGKTTKYLVFLGGTKYATYTGIKAVPSFNENNTFWVGVVDEDHPVAEYVFIDGTSQDDEYSEITFYAHEARDLKITSHLSGGISYYAITGGYVNGEKETLYILAEGETSYTGNANVMAIVNGCGALMDVYTVEISGIKFGYYVEPISVEENFILSTETYAIYAGAAEDAYLDKDVLIANGEDYDVDGATVISYKNKSLKWHIENDENAYIFVVYDKTTGKTFDKNAIFVYIGTEAGASAFEVAYAKYAELVAELEALIKKMNTQGITLAAAKPVATDFDFTIDYNFAMINYLLGEIAAAKVEMEKYDVTDAEIALVAAAGTKITNLQKNADAVKVVAIVDFVESALATYAAYKEIDAEDVTAADKAAVKAAMEKATALITSVTVIENTTVKDAFDLVKTEFNGSDYDAAQFSDSAIIKAALNEVELKSFSVTYVTNEDAAVTVVNKLSYAIAADAAVVALEGLFDKVEVKVAFANDADEAAFTYEMASGTVKNIDFTVTVTVYEKNDAGQFVKVDAATTGVTKTIKVTYKAK